MVTTNYIVIGEAATCTSTAMRQVQVIQLPTLQAIVDNSVICLGEKTNINANGANSYTWNPPHGLSSGSSNFVVANPTSSMNYTLIGTNGVCTASLSVPIIVLQKPVLNLTTSAPRICFGNKSTIFASGAQTYSWEPMADTTVANYAIVSPSVTTNYTVTGVNFTGTVGCAFTKEIQVEVVPQVTASVSNSVVICEGQSVRLSAGGSNTYLWAPGVGLNNQTIAQPYANPNITTEYTVYVSNGGYCSSKATVLVKVNPMPVVDAGPDLKFNSDEPMYLDAKGTGTLTWVMGDGILCHVCPNSQFMTKQSGVYQIRAVNEFGCTAEDFVNIEVTNEYSIYIPNVFTPNFDDKNDTFLVYGVGISDISVTIFDRWGEQIYHDDNQTKGWDGVYKDEIAKNDVYIYLVKYTALDGKKHTKTGHVTLLK
jgi:gliding motility-associated-like protein